MNFEKLLELSQGMQSYFVVNLNAYYSITCESMIATILLSIEISACNYRIKRTQCEHT